MISGSVISTTMIPRSRKYLYIGHTTDEFGILLEHPCQSALTCLAKKSSREVAPNRPVVLILIIAVFKPAARDAQLHLVVRSVFNHIPEFFDGFVLIWFPLDLPIHTPRTKC